MQKTLNKYDLKRMLRISDPFLLVDTVDNIVPKKSGIGQKVLKKDDWFFASHFTDEPVIAGDLTNRVYVANYNCRFTFCYAF